LREAVAVSELASDQFNTAACSRVDERSEESVVSELASDQFNTAACSRVDERSEESM
jgi:hypothetical protein